LKTGMRELAAPERIDVHAFDINDEGTTVGNAYVAGEADPHVVMWTREGEFVDLGELPGHLFDTAAVAVNNLDHAVGGSHHREGHRAIYWSEETGIIDLGLLPGMTHSGAVDINDSDWVVGTSRNPGPTSAGNGFLWTPDLGMLDLNDLLEPDSADWIIHEASQITQAGSILATATRDGEYHTVLLTVHTPEPAALLLLRVAAGPLLLRRPRKAQLRGSAAIRRRWRRGLGMTDRRISASPTPNHSTLHDPRLVKNPSAVPGPERDSLVPTA
jgi:hypothetical protein